MKKIFAAMACSLFAAAVFAAEEDEMQKEAPALNWDAAPVDIVLQTYSEQTDRTILKDPETPNPTITLKTREGQKLTKEEYLHAIEVVLEMNGIHLEPYGDKFIRALPRKDLRKKGIPLVGPDAKLGESEKVVSMWIPFKNIATDEAQKALEGFKSNSGILLVFERTNTILVTDTEQNINRMLEVARAIDVASPVMENVFVEQIKNASASDIKTALEAIVQESQKEQEKNGKGVNNAANQNASTLSARPAPGSRLLGNRPGQQNSQPAQPESNASLVTSVSDADRGMIRGKVLILADERSNKLIIVTQKTNMDFFRKVIEQLDVETTPDTVVKVYRLKYAEAEEVSDMINDLIGNAASSKSSSKQNQNANAKAGSGANLTRNNSTTSTQKTSANQRTGEAKAGELTKDNTTVLADKRINGLVVMTNKELVPVVEQIIESMDVKLSQVLVETVIIEVLLTDGLSTGIDWVHGMAKKGSRYAQALGGGGGTSTAVPSSDATASTLIDGASTTLPTVFPAGGSGLSYSLFSRKLNLSAIIKASKDDSHSKYVASPIVMTVDNKEATIDATENRQFLTGWTAQSSGYSGGGQPTPNYSSKDIGLKLKITPKINPNGTVMLAVEEEYSQFLKDGQSMLVPHVSSGSVTYETEGVDLAVERKMSADILLENSQTVVLGGLTETKIEESESGIPILKDIPWIGKWLFGKVEQKENRKELLVFLTPYVLDDAQAAQAEALRRKKTMSDTSPWDDHGWSASELADPTSQKEQMRRIQAEWKKQDEERKTRLAIEAAKAERVKAIEKMSEEERALWLEEHREEVERERQQKLEEQLLDEESQSKLRELAEELHETSQQEEFGGEAVAE